jgi:uncharacterized membrane protein (UPF0127 family)
MAPKRKISVWNKTRNTCLASAAEVAETGATRRTGLLKHDHLEAGQGMWIVPCESVHTFFMKFPIDLVYLDRRRKVRKVREKVGPWRVSACLLADSVLELPAGTVAETQTCRGDELVLEPA